jgi:hypothetical protein
MPRDPSRSDAAILDWLETFAVSCNVWPKPGVLSMALGYTQGKTLRDAVKNAMDVMEKKDCEVTTNG